MNKYREEDKVISTDPMNFKDMDVMMADKFLDSLEGLSEKQREEYRNWALVFGKGSRLANIRREDIPSYLQKMRYMKTLYKLGLDTEAKEQQAEMLLELNLSASVDGRQMEIGFGGVRRTEQISRSLTKDELGHSKWKKLFKGNRKEEDEL